MRCYWLTSRLRVIELEAGFTCFEEYDRARRKEAEEQRADWRKRVEEETGKTWEEYWKTHPQRAKTPPEPFPGCDCEGLSKYAAGVNLMLIGNMIDHPIPMFCPKTLVDCRTQDAHDLSCCFEAKCDQDIRDLKIDPEDKSKRLSQSAIGKYWETSTQEGPEDWPPWLKGDAVLQRIAQLDQNNDYKRRIPMTLEEGQKVGESPPSLVFTESQSDLEMSSSTRPLSSRNCSSDDDNLFNKPNDELIIEGQGAAHSPHSNRSGRPDNKPVPSSRPKRTNKSTDKGHARLTRVSGVRKKTTKSGKGGRQGGKKGISTTTGQTQLQNEIELDV
ncbi:hypothetical protein GJ744_003530 [Endocarpon pusillum]|uniref:Uncharacterized protein n=1 Tax=Endocarpon pusillum TaxID=364733 RepID=A0A8H7AP80_9EURO|nr:hypothetical protein GJ744_003530 [Endocarpon pusillum]